jgi:hypothetical protein
MPSLATEEFEELFKLYVGLIVNPIFHPKKRGNCKKISPDNCKTFGKLTPDHFLLPLTISAV